MIELLRKFGGWVVALVTALLFAYTQGKAKKQKEIHAKEIEKAQIEIARNKVETENQIKQIGNANEVKDETSSLDDDDVISRLRKEYQRD